MSDADIAFENVEQAGKRLKAAGYRVKLDAYSNIGDMERFYLTVWVGEDFYHNQWNEMIPDGGSFADGHTLQDTTGPVNLTWNEEQAKALDKIVRA